MKRQTWLIPLLAALGLLLPACNLIPEPREDPTHYYSLNLPPEASTVSAALEGGLKIGLRDIEVPAYLRKGILAVREGDTELIFNEYARWAEPLDAGFARLLVASLQADPRVVSVSKHPLPLDETRDYEVALQIRAAEGLRSKTGNEVLFRALVQVFGRDGKRINQHIFTAKDLSWDGKDLGLLAKQLGKALQDLSADILASLPEKTATGK